MDENATSVSKTDDTGLVPKSAWFTQRAATRVLALVPCSTSYPSYPKIVRIPDYTIHQRGKRFLCTLLSNILYDTQIVPIVGVACLKSLDRNAIVMGFSPTIVP
jgi:hypothetical protein